MEKRIKIAIAGGGTGGHLFPALAVGEVFLSRGCEVLVFISEKEVDALATKGRDDFRFETLPSVGMPPLFSLRMLSFLSRFNASLKPCRKILAEFEPDAVLGMGGFTSTPPILAGKLRRVPTFIHESNAIPGKANRLNAKLADTVLLGFEECRRHFPGAQCRVTGTPVRRSLNRKIDRAAELTRFGLRSDGVTVLVMGGSQGAHGINTAVVESLEHLKGKPVQFVHLTGPEDEAMVREAYAKSGFAAHTAAFCHEMEKVYGVADLVIARSGAASLAEIAHFGLPSILIPYPHAAENHQYFNAEIFARAGAATLLREADIDGKALAAVIGNLAGDSGQRRTMAARCTALAPEDAAIRVADTIERRIQTRGGRG
ncbi:MAG TPA: undecaprenyldiphospho-muramoylpentapeptide beta-N-acetylglucosaminyltransferase [Chthoniobacteraceae bacterium]|nr:undecaprenyldiphospho-muramoylpentapeptide beta-N-acetylglucosaminyltransferase [Chthoniobacteraceae bacterium]